MSGYGSYGYEVEVNGETMIFATIDEAKEYIRENGGEDNV